MSESQEQFNIDNAIKQLPLQEKLPVVALKRLLDERQKIDEQQEQKIQEIKKKYYQQIKPLLARASQILKGGALLPEQYAGAQEFLSSNQKIQNYVGGRQIDGYWNGVLSNSAIVDEINEEDEKAIEYLIDIKDVENSSDDAESLQLIFTFKPNPYFKEQTLRRKLICKEGQAICLQGDKITWKQGKCLTHQIKNVSNKKTGEKKLVQGKKIKSFFDIFLNEDATNSEAMAWVSGIMSELYNLVISNHIDYFLGLVNADDESDEQFDDDNDDDEEQIEEK